jgi:hypothetical protein
MSEQNGVRIEGMAPQMPVNPVVALAEQVLAAAKAGQIDTLCAIMVDSRGAVLCPWQGGRLGDLFVGAGTLQWRIMSTIHQNPQHQSRIIPVRG